MRSLLLAALVLPLLSGCHDWDKEYSACVTSGKCGELKAIAWTSNGDRIPGDFGNVPGLGLAVTTVTLTNTGSAPLHNLTGSLTGANAGSL